MKLPVHLPSSPHKLNVVAKPRFLLYGTKRFFVFGDLNKSGAWVRERPVPERPPTYCVFGIYYLVVSDLEAAHRREMLTLSVLDGHLARRRTRRSAPRSSGGSLRASSTSAATTRRTSFRSQISAGLGGRAPRKPLLSMGQVDPQP
jgi:hypothetical protein